jgi:DNA-binding response OmpR family regulator
MTGAITNAVVLVVDDEVRMASAVAEALVRGGCECLTCSSGQQALTLLSERHVDAVVTDWRMPEIDGLELLRRVQSARPGTPVILLTAYGDVPSAVAAMREGAYDYLTKPFDNEELRSVNEELHSVNLEHARKITELTEVTEDLENLLHTIDVGVLFLDDELYIRRVNHRIGELLHILPQDVQQLPALQEQHRCPGPGGDRTACGRSWRTRRPGDPDTNGERPVAPGAPVRVAVQEGQGGGADAG